jgi:hypothetical protein
VCCPMNAENHNDWIQALMGYCALSSRMYVCPTKKSKDPYYWLRKVKQSRHKTAKKIFKPCCSGKTRRKETIGKTKA